MANLKGVVRGVTSISGSVSGKASISGSISDHKHRLMGRLISVHSDKSHVDVFEGVYEVTPKASEAQILNTDEKYMKQDIVVKPIPYYETSNNFDGKTVYIGG